jgi:hypothetical protein
LAVKSRQRVSTASCSHDPRLVPQLLDGNKYSYSVTNLLDSHLLQDLLVTFKEICPIKVVCSKRLLVLTASYGPQPVDDFLLIPGST